MELILKIVLFAPPILLAITFHEVAHGWAARSLGDPTAAQMGRLTLNPLKHIDPVGTILIPAILFILPGNFLFGWAKPVPVDMNKLHEPKRDMALVAAAGPASNFVMAFLWALVAKFGYSLNHGGVGEIFVVMGTVGILINLVLMVLNMIPVPPLDGGRVLAGVLPDDMSIALNRIEPYGLFIIFGLLATGLLGQLIIGPFQFFQSFIQQIVGLNIN